MFYFKHADLVNEYHVSLKTVHNWIDNAKQGKIGLQLFTTTNRTYIANTPGNIVLLTKLAKAGKKFRNTSHQRVISPRPEFYEIYTQRQILDIITHLSVHGEVPREYNYMRDGATNWDNWLKRLAAEESTNILKGTLELVQDNVSVIDQVLQDSERVNIIDLGVGNAYPVKDLLSHLLEKNLLHRYIGIDISPAMLNVAERNIKGWFGNRVHFEGHVRDMTYERFDDLLVGDMLSARADKTINLVLLLGTTPINFHRFSDVFTTVYGSMGANDVLLCTNKPDTEEARRYFDFSPTPNAATLSPNHQYILDLLNIDPSLYEPEMGFDKVKMMRYIRVRLKAAITLKFSFNNIERSVDLEKGDTILLLRMWHLTALEIIGVLDDAGFTLLHSSTTKDRQHLLTISGVETKIESEQ